MRTTVIGTDVSLLNCYRLQAVSYQCMLLTSSRLYGQLSDLILSQPARHPEMGGRANLGSGRKKSTHRVDGGERGGGENAAG